MIGNWIRRVRPWRLACVTTWLSQRMCSHQAAVRRYDTNSLRLACPDCGWQSAGLQVDVKPLAYQRGSWDCTTQQRPVRLKA
jgi:hypothetical protein